MNNAPDYVQFYEVEDGKAFNEITGQTGTEPKVMIGYDSDYYWLPTKSIIQTRHRCKVLPEKCLYFTTKAWHLPQHEQRCTDQTKVKTKQVYHMDYFIWSIY